jgi:hypothetical protein
MRRNNTDAMKIIAPMKNVITSNPIQKSGSESPFLLTLFTNELCYVGSREIPRKGLNQVFELSARKPGGLSGSIEDDVSRRLIWNVLSRIEGVSPNLTDVHTGDTAITLARRVRESELVSSISRTKATREVSRGDTRKAFSRASDSD